MSKRLNKLFSWLKNYGYKKCGKCGGTGRIMLPPFYAKKMPDPISYPCDDCDGKGYIYVVPNNIRIIREAEYKMN